MAKKKSLKTRRPIRKELVDELLSDCRDSGDLVGPQGLLKQLTGALVERMLEGELDAHLGYNKHQRRPMGATNARNGAHRRRSERSMATFRFGCREIERAHSSPSS